MAGLVALTHIKYGGGFIEVGTKVQEKNFTKEEWETLKEAGAVGSPPVVAESTEEEEEEEETPTVMEEKK